MSQVEQMEFVVFCTVNADIVHITIKLPVEQLSHTQLERNDDNNQIRGPKKTTPKTLELTKFSSH